MVGRTFQIVLVFRSKTEMKMAVTALILKVHNKTVSTENPAQKQRDATAAAVIATVMCET